MIRWIIGGVVVLAVLLGISFMMAMSNHTDETPAPAKVASGSALSRGGIAATTKVGPDGVPVSTNVQTLRGVPAEIDALGDAAQRTGGKVNGVVILDARKKLRDNLPPKPESQRAMDAKRLWTDLKQQQDFMHGCVLQNKVQFGPNDGVTARSKRAEYEAALAAKEARDDYAEILRNEGFTETQIKEKIEGR